MSGCVTGKRVRRSYIEAVAAAIRCTRRGRSFPPYHCDVCGFWHLTKRRST